MKAALYTLYCWDSPCKAKVPCLEFGSVLLSFEKGGIPGIHGVELWMHAFEGRLLGSLIEIYTFRPFHVLLHFLTGLDLIFLVFLSSCEVP